MDPRDIKDNLRDKGYSKAARFLMLLGQEEAAKVMKHLDEEEVAGISREAVWGFVLWSVVYVIISLATPAPPEEQVENTTWTHPVQVIFHGRLTGSSDPRLLAGVRLILMIVLYAIFR